jgi:hypothetical protein
VVYSVALIKAFDSVDHDVLLSKLEFYGIRGKFKELIKSYLNNRYQRVSITSKKNPAIAVIIDGRRLDVVCLRNPYLVHFFFFCI